MITMEVLAVSIILNIYLIFIPLSVISPAFGHSNRVIDKRVEIVGIISFYILLENYKG